MDDYTHSQQGMQLLAASCMMLESLGEGAKKVDRLLPGMLSSCAPDIPWRMVMGLRDHIAHGYFNLDAEIIYDVVTNEVPVVKDNLNKVISSLSASES